VPGQVVLDEELVSQLRALRALPVTQAGDATEKLLLKLQKRVPLHAWKTGLVIGNRHERWRLEFDQRSLPEQGKGEWSPSFFDRLFPVSQFDLKEYKHLAAGQGAGAPVVLGFEDIKALRTQRNFRPGNGLYLPATAVLEFGKSSGSEGDFRVRLHLLNTFEKREARLAGRRVPLAWNLSAVVEANLGNPYIQANGLRGLLRADQHTDDVGVFGIDGFQRGKIPVLFVHGLNSGPGVWKNEVNEIYARPELRSRYFPLLFLYPTGLSVPASAARLRVAIQQYRDYWDPKHEEPLMDRMVLVGHSMGGLLSRLQVIDSGEELWKSFFTRPPGAIPWISDRDKKAVEGSLKFQPLPSVQRVVFVAVPHRGSQLADLGVVRLAVRLIRLPVATADLVASALTEDLSLLNPALLKYHSLGLRSVDMLSPGHPYFSAINEKPISVPYHSIIGDRGKGTMWKSSDGVVPYWSSHLEGAVSERLVPCGHSCTQHPEAVEEMARILQEHIRSL
jgi:pimeloyl-ACP methyl ester carboxylesterase